MIDFTPKTKNRVNINHCTKNEVFHQGFLQLMRPNPHSVTLIEEILYGKLNFFCIESIKWLIIAIFPPLEKTIVKF